MKLFTNLYDKTIIITESQARKLVEAADSDFSLEELESLGVDDAYKYCVDKLGNPFANGSSRTCFTISDDKVLKLAHNEKGVAQNKIEYTIYKNAHSFILPEIYDVSNDFSWLVCEHVLPCSYEDFEQLFGKPFRDKWRQNTEGQKYINGKDKGKDKTVGFEKYFTDLKEPNEKYEGVDILSVLWYIDDVYGMHNDENYDVRDTIMYEKIVNGNPWFKEIKRLCEEFNLIDLTQMENYGLVKRNGEMSIVILDYGLDYKTFMDFYS